MGKLEEIAKKNTKALTAKKIVTEQEIEKFGFDKYASQLADKLWKGMIKHKLAEVTIEKKGASNYELEAKLHVTDFENILKDLNEYEEAQGKS